MSSTTLYVTTEQGGVKAKRLPDRLLANAGRELADVYTFGLGDTA